MLARKEGELALILRMCANGLKHDRSVTLVGEADRKMLKAAIKHASGEDKVRHRQVPTEAVAKWSQRLEHLKKEITEILQEEKEEKQVSCMLL